MHTGGVVRQWRADEGWGVIESDETPGGCWTHWTTVRVAGPPALTEGLRVNFTFRERATHGFDYETCEVWRHGEEPVDDSIQLGPDSPAMQSTLSLTFHEPEEEA